MMKKIVLLAFVLVLLSTTLSLCVIGLLRLHIAYASPYTSIDIDTAYDMITNGSYPDLVVLDVRTKGEYDGGHIYGAVWIPVSDLEARIGELAGHENHETIVYCASGVRSATASGILDSYNFTKVYNMLGGISAWQVAGYPVWIATVHNVNTTFNYDTIQAAIDAPQTLNGHTILADAGTYYENVVVNKSVSVIGENRSTTIIDGSGIGTVVTINTNNVNINGFMIQNSGPSVSAWDWPPDSGVLFADGSTGNFFGGNTIQNNGFGVVLDRCNNNTLKNNNITGNIYNFYVSGDFFYGYQDWLHNIDETNTVDGKPIYYWINQHDKQIPTDAGCVYVINSTDIRVKDVEVAHNGDGVTLVVTYNSTIETVKVSSNFLGISLVSDSPSGQCNTIIGNSITNNEIGILLNHSPNNTVIGNTISNNSYGIYLYSSYFEYTYPNNNLIVGNTISNSEVAGIYLPENANSHNSTIYHNNFIDNTKHVDNFDSINFWDNGSEGNYWGNYTGFDSNHDGIGDSWHEISENNTDHYPLMGPFQSFNTSLDYYVNVISNSTIEDLTYFESNSTIKIHVSNMTLNQTFGFCRVAIPKSLVPPPYTVVINDGLTGVLYFNDTIYDNGTHRWIYFAYEHSTHKVVIIPEIPTWTSMLLILIVLMVAVIIYKRRLLKHQ